MTTVRSIFALLVVCLVTAESPCQMEPGLPDPSTDSSLPTLKYRRLYVPEQRLDEKATRSYWPMRRDKFERLVNEFAVSSDRQLGGARIVAARYDAHVSDAAMTGKAILDIVHTAPGPIMMPLEPCGLAIGSVQWESSDTGMSNDPTLSLSPSGQTVAAIDDSGKLSFDWTLRADKESAFGTIFTLNLPNATSSRLFVSIPTDQIPLADSLLMRPQLVERNEAHEDGIDTATWLLEFSGAGDFTFHAVPESVANANMGTVLLDEAFAYSFLSNVVRASVDLKLDILETPLRRLELQLDSAFQLTTARIDERELAWRQSPGSQTAVKTIVLMFDEPLEGKDRLVRLEGQIPLSLGKPFRLPHVHVDDVTWQEGISTLAIARPLSMQDVTVSACHLVQAGSLGMPGEGEYWQLQHHSPNRRATVIVDRLSTHASVVCGTTVTATGSELSAQLKANLRADQGERFDCQIELPLTWAIQSISAQSRRQDGTWEDVLFDWDDSQVTGSDPKRKLLHVQLKKAFRADRSVQLDLGAHRPLPKPDERIRIDQLRFGPFLDVRETRHIVSILHPSEVAFHFDGDSALTRIDPAELTLAEQELVDADPRAIVFLADSSATPLTVQLKDKPTGYSAEISVHAALGGDQLEETYSIQCVPDDASVDRVLVHLSRDDAQDIEWWIENEIDGFVTARRLNDEERQAEEINTEEGEIWDLHLIQPQENPFALFGRRTRSLVDRAAVGLAWLPRANSQTGRLEISSTAGSHVSIEQENLKPIPAADVTSRLGSATRAVFRYDPSDPARVTVLETAEKDRFPLAWVWSCDVNSLFGPTGATHQARFFIENAGVLYAKLQKPHGTILRDVQIDGQSVTVSPRVVMGSEIVLSLPVGQRFVCVEMTYTDRQILPRFFGELNVQLPTADLQILEMNAVAWLPPSHSPRGSLSDDRWMVRLFGPLVNARTSGSSGSLSDLPFDRQPESATRAGKMKSPWTERNEGLDHYYTAKDWTARRIDRLTSNRSGSAPVEVYQPRVFQAFGWACFLMATSFAWLVGRKYPFTLWYLLISAGLIALAVPEWLSPLGSGAFLGVLFGAVFALMHSHSGSSESVVEPDPDRSAIVTKVPLSATSIILALAMSSVLLGDESAVSESKSDRETLYRVIVPVDAHRVPFGEYVFLPREFYDAIQELEESAGSVAHEWLIHSGTYEGALKWVAVGSQLAPAEFSVTYDIEVKRQDTRVVLPLRRDQVHLLAAGSALNGEPVRLEWLTGGAGLAVDIDRTGSYQLRLAFLPVTGAEGDNRIVQFAIPTLVQSKLLLRFPQDAKGVQIRSTRGIVEAVDALGSLNAQLGPVDQLLVQWPAQSIGSPLSSEEATKQLLWLKVGPGSVSVDARYYFHTSSDTPIEQVQLQLDPRWLFRVAPNQPFGEPVHRQTPLESTIDLPVRVEDAESPLRLDATLVLPGASAIGRLQLPNIHVLGHRPGQRMLAVSVSPALSSKVIDAGGAKTIGTALFADLWGEMSSPASVPQVCFSLPADQSSWTLATEPAPVETIADQRTEISVASGLAHVQYECHLDTTRGYHLRHQLSVPRNLRIQSVSLSMDSIQRTVRWSQPRRTVLNLFFDERISGTYKLLLRGWQPIPRRGELTAPRISCTSATVRESIVEINRLSEVDLQVAETDGYLPLDDVPLGKHHERLGRLVASLRENSANERAARPIVLSAKPNRPRVRTIQVTEVNRVDGQWKADVTFLMNVEAERGGTLDTIRVDIPDAFVGPFQIEPAGIEIVETHTSSRHSLVIWPELPVDDEYRLRIRGNLTSQPIEVPDVVAIDVQSTSRFLALPVEHQGERIEWDVSGATKDKLPRRYGPPQDAEGQYDTYLIARPTFHAMVQDLKRVQSEPRVLLADVRAQIGLSGRCHGMVTLDVEPGGRSRAVLLLPQNYRLVNATVDQLPAMLRTTQANQYELVWGSVDLPQRIVVVYKGQAKRKNSESVNEWQLDAPRLLDVPADRTLWTVYGEHRNAGAERSMARLWSDLFHHQQLRYRNIWTLIQQADQSMKHRPTEEADNWYALWARRFAMANRRLLYQQEISDPSTFVREDEEREHVALTMELGISHLSTQATMQTMALIDSAGAWESIAQSDRIELVATQGNTEPLDVKVHQANYNDAAARLLQCLSLAGCCLALLFFIRQTHLSQWFVAWPYAFGVLLGLAWWLWLWPAFMGLLIIAASVIGSLRIGLSQSALGTVTDR